MNVEITQDHNTRIASIAGDDTLLVEQKGDILIIHVEIRRKENFVVIKRSELDAILKALDGSINPEKESN